MTPARRAVALAAVAFSLAACATGPTGPSVLVLPGSAKSFPAFESDDLQCRGFAERSAGVAPPEQVAGTDAAAGAVVGTAIGAAAGALIGAATGNAGPGAAIGAGSGLLLGSASGYSIGGAHGASVQQRYDNAYLQCMYASGNRVPVAGSEAAPPPPAQYRAGSGRRLPPPPPPGLPPPPPPGAG